MTVRELIDHLSTFPPDAIVICTMCSDYRDIEKEDVTLMAPEGGEGLIRHHGHLMWLREGWWPKAINCRDAGDRPADPVFLTAVHFVGN